MSVPRAPHLQNVWYSCRIRHWSRSQWRGSSILQHVAPWQCAGPSVFWAALCTWHEFPLHRCINKPSSVGIRLYTRVYWRGHCNYHHNVSSAIIISRETMCHILRRGDVSQPGHDRPELLVCASVWSWPHRSLHFTQFETTTNCTCCV